MNFEWYLFKILTYSIFLIPSYVSVLVTKICCNSRWFLWMGCFYFWLLNRDPYHHVVWFYDIHVTRIAIITIRLIIRITIDLFCSCRRRLWHDKAQGDSIEYTQIKLQMLHTLWYCCIIYTMKMSKNNTLKYSYLFQRKTFTYLYIWVISRQLM